MSTNMPGFQSFFRFLLYFVLDKLASSIMVRAPLLNHTTAPSVEQDWNSAFEISSIVSSVKFSLFLG